MRNQNGFSIIEAVIGAVVLSVSIVGVTRFMAVSQTQLASNMTTFNVDGLRTRALGLISDQISWDRTVANNPSMACSLNTPVNCSNQIVQGDGINIDLYGYDGRVFVSTAANQGFTAAGDPCSDFSAAGSTECPIRMEIRWRLMCGSTPCRYPTEVVSVIFRYAPGETDRFPINNIARFNIMNFNRRSLAFDSSPVVACAALGRTFVGWGNTVTSGDNTIHTADGLGCVPLTAFKGYQGFQGFQGPQGPKGPLGPQGPIVAAPVPDPPATPDPLATLDPEVVNICSTYPQICEFYDRYLNRYPEREGAAFWASAFANGQSSDVIEEHFRIVSQGGVYMHDGLDVDQLWNDIAQAHSLPTEMSAEYCVNAVECMSLSATAHEEYSRAVSTYCAANPTSCYLVYGPIVPR